MLQYNQNQYNPLQATSRAMLNRHYFYAVLFTVKDLNKDQYDKETLTPQTIINVKLYDNGTNNFWQFNMDKTFDSLILNHKLGGCVDTNIWFKKGGKQLFFKPRMIDENTIAVDFPKGQLDVGTELVIGIQRVKKYTDNYPLANKTFETSNSFNTYEQEEQQSQYTKVALVYRANTLEGLFSVIETIDEEFWKSSNDDYVSHSIRDVRKNQDVDVHVHYTKDIDSILSKYDSTIEVKKTWI